jgi:hypothetical protein
VLAFVVSQVVIDCETAYFLFVAQEWPFHRWAHTFLVGTPIGCLAGLSVWASAVFLRGRGLLASLHLACLVAGAVGAVLCVLRLKKSRMVLGLAALAAASGPGPLDGDVPAHYARLHDAVPRKRGSSLPSPERW